MTHAFLGFHGGTTDSGPVSVPLLRCRMVHFTREIRVKFRLRSGVVTYLVVSDFVHRNLTEPLKKPMKNKLLLVLAALTAATPVIAQTAPSTPSATWTITPSVVSQYMFRGVRLGGTSFQPAVEFGYGNLALGVWSNFPIEDEVPGVSDPEFDFYGSYSFAVNDALSVTPGVTVYWYPDADQSAGFFKSTLEPNLALSYTVAGFELTPKIYYDTELKGFTYELAAGYSVPVPALNTELSFTGLLGTYKWDDVVKGSAADVKNWGDYWSVGVSAPFAITDNSKVTLGFNYMKGTNNFYKEGTTPRVRNNAAVGKPVFSAAYSLSF